MRKNVLAGVLAVAMGASLITGCGGKETGQKAEQKTEQETEQKAEKEETKTEEKKELTKIIVTEPVREIMWAPVFAADALGYFEEEGLEVEVKAVQGESIPAPVLAGDAQIGLWGPEMPCKFVTDGQDMQLFYSCTDKYPYSFFMTKGLKDIKELKGATINAAHVGGAPRAFVRTVLKNAGLDPDTDATYIHVNNSAVLTALDSGEIKATYASPSLRTSLIEAGYEVCMDIYDEEVHNTLIGTDGYPGYICFAKKSYMEENPQIIQGFTNACYKAAQYLENSSAEDIAAILKDSFTEMTNLEQVVKECKEHSVWNATGQFSEEGVEAINRMAMESGLIEKPVSKEQLVNATFAETAEQRFKK